MLMTQRPNTGWGNLIGIQDKAENNSTPVGFLWFYDTACPTTNMIMETVSRIVREQGSWTGDELSNAISRRWMPCACKFLPYDGGKFHESYAIDLKHYAGPVRE